jgi:hypothetical protein
MSVGVGWTGVEFVRIRGLGIRRRGCRWLLSDVFQAFGMTLRGCPREVKGLEIEGSTSDFVNP